MSTTWQHIKGEILINATIFGKEGAGDKIAEWIVKLQADVKTNEPGTLEFSNAAALKQHLKNSLMQEFNQSGLVAKPPSALFYTNIRGDMTE
ncbi:hypothetical protein B0H13DRAFT_2364820 [Mycena leptocephala]|nr:hypothetical protein B0H13DRAFT_2364820 [Mycena leptocephala]